MAMIHQMPTENETLLSTGTMVLWVSCVCVGLTGQMVKYPWPHAPIRQPAPVQAKLISVEIMKDMASSAEASLPSVDMAGPSPAPSIVTPAAPPLMAVAAPKPGISFAAPVTGPTRIVEAKQAVLGPPLKANATPSTASASTPRQLTFGQGEGRQPAPEYPQEAVLAGQTGVVVVRFSVAEDGRVERAQAISPCPFPLLNHAAVSAVRDTWRFPAGPERLYEVPIEFQITRQ